MARQGVVRDPLDQPAVAVGLRAGERRQDRRDPDELQRENAELRAKVEELSALLALLPGGILIADAECRLITGNRAFYKMLGLPYGSNVSLTTQRPDLPPGTRVMRGGRELSPEEYPMQAAGRTGRRVVDFDHDIVFPDGRTVTLLATTVPLLDELGEVRCVVGAYLDITERQRAEQALAAAREELARQVENLMRLNAIAEQARRDAEAATRSRDEFLAMLGHELRNPLGAIHNAVFVLREIGAHDPAAARRALDVVSRQLGHLGRLMDDLLDAGRVIAGKIAVSRRPLNLGEVAERALDTLRARHATYGRRLAVACDPVWIDGDATRVEQIVNNLLGNALKFTPGGGSVELRVRAEDALAVLEVSDTGAGIAPELLPRVFELFVQGSVPLDRAEGGLGVGLTLVSKLVELHGGSVAATSPGPGRGSTFTVRLPRIPGPGAAVSAAPVAEASRPARQPLRVLVVEDNADSREMLATSLRLAGHEVCEAADGPAGIEAAGSREPDVAIVDIGLPGVDGFEVARRIRAGTAGRTRLVALTGYGLPEDQQRAREAGFDAHVTKPVDPKVLLERLAALAGRDARRPAPGSGSDQL
jgi:two-component system, sensor histidine kinase